jgi:DNA-binding NtrC family response regulator
MHSTVLQGKHVLIVDDNTIIQAALSKITQRLGMIPTCTDNPHHALSLVKVGHFDAVIVDFRMPTMSGTDLYKAIHKLKTKAPPVVFMTGSHFDDVHDELNGHHIKPAGFLPKPFMLDELVVILEKIFVSV